MVGGAVVVGAVVGTTVVAGGAVVGGAVVGGAMVAGATVVADGTVGGGAMVAGATVVADGAVVGGAMVAGATVVSSPPPQADTPMRTVKIATRFSTGPVCHIPERRLRAHRRGHRPACRVGGPPGLPGLTSLQRTAGAGRRSRTETDRSEDPPDEPGLHIPGRADLGCGGQALDEPGVPLHGSCRLVERCYRLVGPEQPYVVR